MPFKIYYVGPPRYHEAQRTLRLTREFPQILAVMELKRLGCIIPNDFGDVFVNLIIFSRQLTWRCRDDDDDDEKCYVAYPP